MSEVIQWPPLGWIVEDCGCCAGTMWGGEYPQECHYCKGSGFLWLHDPSGRYADYPGGPLRGSRQRLGPPKPRAERASS